MQVSCPQASDLVRATALAVIVRRPRFVGEQADERGLGRLRSVGGRGACHRWASRRLLLLRTAKQGRVQDPDGASWDVYTVLADVPGTASTQTAPCCTPSDANTNAAKDTGSVVPHRC